MDSTPVTLHFHSPSAEHHDRKPIRDGLSSVVKVGDYIFLACDEGSSIERLKHTKKGYEEHTLFDVADYIPLAGNDGTEIDIEGIDFENHYLWITGSHGLKRKKNDPDKTIKKQIKQLSKVESEPNRYILARIPLVEDPESKEFHFYKSCPHPDDPDKELTAAILQGKDDNNDLTEALQEDIHIKDFLKIPGKDNGFDIEGLTLDGDRVFLGLRGPVLRGWAVILEIETEEIDKHTLTLKSIGPKKQKYKKHFLDLSGMGIRELTPAGKDLLILAGPTMDLDGTISLYRWKNAITQTRTSKKSVVYEHQVVRLFDIPHGTQADSGKDKAEGITLIDNHQLLVVYDSPSDKRKVNKTDVVADIIPIEGNNKKIKPDKNGKAQ